MKEMRLFEVGLKNRPRDTSYSYKYNVAAEDAHDAEDKVRGFILEDHIAWWEEDGRVMAEEEMEADGEEPTVSALDNRLREQLEDLKSLCLAKLYDVGTLIV